MDRKASEILGSKGNKIERNYHFLWREVGGINCGFRNADCGMKNKSFIQNRKPGPQGQSLYDL